MESILFFFTLDFIARRYGATMLRLEAGTLPVAFVFAYRSKFHAIGQNCPPRDEVTRSNFTH